MKKKGKLIKEERLEIEILRKRNYSIREIARVLNRNPSTISRELRRNKQQRMGVYIGDYAQHKASIRKKYSRFQWKKINENTELKMFIIDKLKKHWNPDEISGFMKENKLPFYASKTSIYEWLYSTQGLPYCQYLYTRRYTKRRRLKKTKRVMIPNRISIKERPLEANRRINHGHLEVDTIVSGKRGRGALLIAVDRKNRCIDIRKLKSMKPQETIDKLKIMLQNKDTKSITFDNGIENRYHEQLKLPTFFCSPYSSWQKGSVENVNKMIRRYIPKGTNIESVPTEYIKKIESLINKKPRKILGYKSAYDVMMENRLLKESVAIEG